jgi:hypothetical protein
MQGDEPAEVSRSNRDIRGLRCGPYGGGKIKEVPVVGGLFLGKDKPTSTRADAVWTIKLVNDRPPKGGGFSLPRG